jgi:hypothetical protein
LPHERTTIEYSLLDQTTEEFGAWLTNRRNL